MATKRPPAKEPSGLSKLVNSVFPGASAKFKPGEQASGEIGRRLDRKNRAAEDRSDPPRRRKP